MSSLDTRIADAICEKIRKKRNDTYAILSSVREEKKAIQLRARAVLLDDLMQEIAYIKSDFKRNMRLSDDDKGH